jgi:ABC-2 type transport system ATP-binding protein
VHKQQESSRVSLVTSDNTRSVQLLKTLQTNAQQQNGKLLLPLLPPDQIAQLNRHLVQNDIDVYHLAVEKNDLESIFMELVKN